MALTPMSMHDASERCFICDNHLTVENCAVVFACFNGSLTIGDCCIGMFMSSMIQDYATLLQRYHAEHLIHASSGKAVAKACAEISRRSFQWADIMASLQKPSAKFSISLDQFDEDK